MKGVVVYVRVSWEGGSSTSGVAENDLRDALVEHIGDVLFSTARAARSHLTVRRLTAEEASGAPVAPRQLWWRADAPDRSGRLAASTEQRIAEALSQPRQTIQVERPVLLVDESQSNEATFYVELLSQLPSRMDVDEVDVDASTAVDESGNASLRSRLPTEDSLLPDAPNASATVEQKTTSSSEPAVAAHPATSVDQATSTPTLPTMQSTVKGAAEPIDEKPNRGGEASVTLLGEDGCHPCPFNPQHRIKPQDMQTHLETEHFHESLSVLRYLPRLRNLLSTTSNKPETTRGSGSSAAVAGASAPKPVIPSRRHVKRSRAALSSQSSSSSSSCYSSPSTSSSSSSSSYSSSSSSSSDSRSHRRRRQQRPPPPPPHPVSTASFSRGDPSATNPLSYFVPPHVDAVTTMSSTGALLSTPVPVAHYSSPYSMDDTRRSVSLTNAPNHIDIAARATAMHLVLDKDAKTQPTEESIFHWASRLGTVEWISFAVPLLHSVVVEYSTSGAVDRFLRAFQKRDGILPGVTAVIPLKTW